jgi:endonuclease/exonuclease/phosphatase (EEP) superfamily protein YafD
MVRLVKLLAAPADGVALAVGVMCLLAAAAGQGGRFSARLDVLNHFAPIWLAGAVAAGVYGLVLAGPATRPALAILAVLGVAAAAALMAPEFLRPIRPPVAQDAPRQITLIQFNAWDRNTNVPTTVDWIVAQKPDVVLMQETEFPIRQAMVKQGFHYVGDIADSAIFTRLTTTYAPYVIPAGDWRRLPSFARATLEGPDGAFSVISAHLEWPTHPFQAVQIRALEKLAAHYATDRLIVAGDFNLAPWSFTLRGLDQRLGLERRDRAMFSWPARLSPKGQSTWPLPVLPIDHIYAGRAWRTVSVTHGPNLGSDHYPTVIRLALAD